MRKTTEELVNECVSEIKDNQFDLNNLDAADKQMLFQWFETFRRLAIENERECAEAVAWRTETGYEQPFYLYHELKPIRSNGEALFTFPPAAQVPEGWKLVPIEPTVEIVQAAQDYFASHDEWGFSGVYRAMLAAAPEVKQ